MKVKYIIKLVLILLFATIIQFMTTRQILEFMLLAQILIAWNTED